MTMWRMHFVCWAPKTTNTQSEYVICMAFPLQQWLHERASTLRYTYSILPVLWILRIMLSQILIVE